MGRQYRLGAQRSHLQGRARLGAESRRGQSVCAQRFPHGRGLPALLDRFGVPAPRAGRAARRADVAVRFGFRHPAQPNALFVGLVAHFAH